MAYSNIGSVYDVELGGVGLLTVPGAYAVYSITPFAPRIAVENPSHATLDAYQSFTINNWSHGFGFVNQVDVSGYDFAVGNIDTRQPYALLLFSKQTTLGNPAQQINCFQDFGGYLYAGLQTASGNSTLWKYDPTANTWAAETTTGYPTTAVTDLLAGQDASGNNLLFIALSDTSDIAFRTWRRRGSP